VPCVASIVSSGKHTLVRALAKPSGFLLQVQVLWAYGPVICGEVALKVAEAGVAGAERLLHEEGQTLHMLKHKHMLGFCPRPDPHFMAGGLVLEKCDYSLHDLLARSRLSNTQRWGIVRHLLSALVYTHGQGYTHNDLKPGNILVELDEDGIKLADWGLA
jgi:eukaryotic-like serine/threonine-protein kinase